MRKMTQTCFNKWLLFLLFYCLFLLFLILFYYLSAGKTGNGLDSREQQCLSHCVDRYTYFSSLFFSFLLHLLIFYLNSYFIICFIFKRYFETLTVVATSLSQNDS